MHKALANTVALGFGVLAFTQPVYSADTVVEEQLIPQPPEVEVDTSEWGGFYLGAYGGYSWFDADGATAAGGEADGEGGKIGAYTGYNWQFDNNIVTGLEALGGYSDADASTATVAVEQEWEASLRARLGYAFEQSVIYSFAGLAVTSIEAATLTGSDSETLGGYTLGAGWETFLKDNITARIEYGFSDYEEENFVLGNPASNNIDFQDQSVNVGIGFKY
ncbi:MAG: outer membrane beta-barrel protein [Pseudomonadota bacterium]